MSALVGYRGGLGCRVVTFLKDSIGGTPNFIACQKVSHLCRAYLGMADFFVKTKKSVSTPSQVRVWLGYCLDFSRCSISMQSAKITKLKESISRIFSQRFVTAKDLASIAGQLISVFNYRPFSKMAQVERGLETWGMKYCMVESAERNVWRNENFVRAILEFAHKWLKSKKGRKKGDKYYLEMYLEGVNILSPEDCSIVKVKWHRSMRKTEAPHKLGIVFQSPEEEGIEVTTQCSCKAGTGKCQHLAALFTHVTVKLHDGDPPTSHLQQWHKPQGPSLEPSSTKMICF